MERKLRFVKLDECCMVYLKFLANFSFDTVENELSDVENHDDFGDLDEPVMSTVRANVGSGHTRRSGKRLFLSRGMMRRVRSNYCTKEDTELAHFE